MSEGAPVKLTPSTQPQGASRITRRDRCTVHVDGSGNPVEWGQVYVRGTNEQEAYWDPPYCPQCVEEFRLQKEFEEVKLPALVAEIKTETDAECAAESGRAERIAEMAQEFMTADRAKRFDEWSKQQDAHFATMRAEYIAFADSQDRAEKDAEKIAARRAKFFEQRKNVAAEADAELVKQLDERREKAMKESLGSFALLG
jgi:hypothetical protein